MAGQTFSPMGEKGRFILPVFARKKIRESSGGRVVCLARHEKHNCLIAFGLSRVESFEEKIAQEQEVAIRMGRDYDPTLRAAQLYAFTETGFDDSGRFIMPEPLRKRLPLEEGLYFHGMGDIVMIWSPSILMAMDDSWVQAKDYCEDLVAAAEAKAAAKSGGKAK